MRIFMRILNYGLVTFIFVNISVATLKYVYERGDKDARTSLIDKLADCDSLRIDSGRFVCIYWTPKMDTFRLDRPNCDDSVIKFTDEYEGACV